MTDWVQKQMERIHGEQTSSVEEGQISLWNLGQKGGPGSGHYGHAGRPGKRGGSLPGNVAVSVQTGRTARARQAEVAGGGPDTGKLKPGDTVNIKVAEALPGGGGRWKYVDKPIKVLAARAGLFVHHNTEKKRWEEGDAKGYRLSHAATGASLFPWAFQSKAGATRAMNALAAADIGWDFTDMADFTTEHRGILRSYRDQHLQDFAKVR